MQKLIFTLTLGLNFHQLTIHSQPSKALKFNRQLSKLEKNNRQPSKLPPHWHLEKRGGNACLRNPASGPGEALPYIRQVKVYAAPSGRIFEPFWSENGYTLCPFWSGIGLGFRESYGRVWTLLSFQFQISKKEREISEFEMDLNNFCVCALLNDNIIYA